MLPSFVSQNVEILSEDSPRSLQSIRQASHQLLVIHWFRTAPRRHRLPGLSGLPAQSGYTIRTPHTPTLNALTDFMYSNPTLKAIDLWKHGLTDDAAFIIAQVLRTNRTLKHLSLRQNRIGVLGAQALADTLVVNSALTRLDLRYNHIGLAGMTEIAKVLEVNRGLEELNLFSNHLRLEEVPGWRGAQVMAVALQMNSTLTHLNLGDNYIQDLGAQALADALRVNHTLLYLNIERNRITDVGIQALANALVVNKGLQILNLSHNSVTDNGAQALTEGLIGHPSLQELHLYWNDCTIKGFDALLRLVQTNRNILKMGFAYSMVKPDTPDTPDIQTRLKTALQKNRIGYHKQRRMACIQGLEQLERRSRYPKQMEYHILSQFIFPMARM